MQTQPRHRSRKRRSEEEKRSYLERWKTSGLGAKVFAGNEGLSPGDLFRWRRAQQAAAPTPRRSVTFAPVQVSGDASPSIVAPSEPLAPGIALEVEMPSGVRVRVFRGADIRAANELLTALFARRAC